MCGRLLAQVCWFVVAASRAGPQQAGGAHASLAQQGSCCCRPCRLAHDAGGRRAPRLPSKEAGSRDRGRPGVWGQAGSGNWPARDRGWRRPVPERQGAEAEGESEGARDWETGELGLRKRLFVGLGLIVGPLVKPGL